MAETISVPRNALVVVADGRKAIVLRNSGPLLSPKLETERVIEAKSNPATRDQGTDKPGRAAMGTHRSSMGQSDLHEAEEQRFVQRVADELAALYTGQSPRPLVLVAAPRALAELRKALTSELRDLVVAEIDKDFVNLPVAEIEKRLG
mgnify:CR=1 FL=1|jgi:Protein required for attachment to host cells